MSGIQLMMLGMVGGQTYTVTIGNSGNVYGFISGSIGSIAPTTYIDHGGTTRNVTGLAGVDNGDATWTLSFRLDGTPADSDTTFTALVVKGVRYTRASASSSDLGGGVRQWAWAGLGANPVGASGTAAAVIS